MYFARNDQEWRGERLLNLASQVIAVHDTNGEEYHGGFSHKHQGMTSIWSLLEGRVDRGDFSYDWLETQVRLAMTRSLILTENLYYYWASFRYGILASGGRSRLREFICATARAQFTTAQQLLRVLHPTNPYEIFWLINPPGDDGSDGDDVVKTMRGIEYWSVTVKPFTQCVRVRGCGIVSHAFVRSRWPPFATPTRPATAVAHPPTSPAPPTNRTR